MTCKYGHHKWILYTKPIMCSVCGEEIEEYNREPTSQLQYTKDEYDF